MTDPLDLLTSRRSVRSFTGEHVSEQHLDQIVAATQQAPSSINAQGITLVLVRDPERIATIAELAGGQPQVAGADVFVCFVIDFQRTGYAVAKQGQTQEIHSDAEGLLVGAVDAGIALATLQTAAHALGYGTTAIGGVRLRPAEMIQLLELPEHTFPVVGCTIGVPDPARPAHVKPRVPVESYALTERYDLAAVTAGVDEYDTRLRSWWDELGMAHMGTYSEDVARTYSRVYYPEVAGALRDQGFLTR